MQVPVELKIKYLNRRIQDIQKLRDYLEQDDYSFALKLGHQVKGNAVTFEVPELSLLGCEIELAARNKDKEMVKNLVQKMENTIEQVFPNKMSDLAP